MPRIVSITLVLCLMIALALAAVDALNVSGFENERVVVVQKNDTLWQIAEKYCGDDIDIRKAVHQIRKVNGLEDATIYPGQELIVPGSGPENVGMKF